VKILSAADFLKAVDSAGRRAAFKARQRRANKNALPDGGTKFNGLLRFQDFRCKILAKRGEIPCDTIHVLDTAQRSKKTTQSLWNSWKLPVLKTHQGITLTGSLTVSMLKCTNAHTLMTAP
jgi:hypothetical protein